MSFTDRLVIIVSKVISSAAKFTGLGAGATWPGEIVLRLRPAILEKLSEEGIRIIAVTGTNGKTTTVKMIHTILKNAGKKAVRNETGANLDNGIISAFLDNCNWLGCFRSDILVLEIDEAVFPVVLSKLKPELTILLNLFRDQLDRYGEVDTIAEKWAEAIKKLVSRHDKSYRFLINADDPQLALIGSGVGEGVVYFGLENRNYYLPKKQHATDSIYCPSCGQRLTYGGFYFSHLGKWACGKCGLSHPDVQLKSGDFASPLEGIYNIYNTLAAAGAAKLLGIDEDIIRQGLIKYEPAFGRMEEIHYLGKKIKLLLSKNPTGFNESLRTVLDSKKKGPLILVLNDRIPDGRDISWIWDVDFEILKQYGSVNAKPYIIITGDRCYDLGLRLKYAGFKANLNKNSSEKSLEIIRNLEDAIIAGIKHTGDEEVLWILPTYSAMLDIRKIITGRKIL